MLLKHLLLIVYCFLYLYYSYLVLIYYVIQFKVLFVFKVLSIIRLNCMLLEFIESLLIVLPLLPLIESMTKDLL